MKKKDIEAILSENLKMKKTFEYFWKMDFICSGQFIYSIRSNSLQYLDRKIVEDHLNSLKNKTK